MSAGSTPMRSATAIAAGVRSGELSAVEVLDEHLARVALRESEIHAFNHLNEQAARDAAADIDRGGPCAIEQQRAHAGPDALVGGMPNADTRNIGDAVEGAGGKTHIALSFQGSGHGRWAGRICS